MRIFFWKFRMVVFVFAYILARNSKFLNRRRIMIENYTSSILRAPHFSLAWKPIYRVSQKTLEFSDEFEIVFFMN